jgi:hypothetical protein
MQVARLEIQIALTRPTKDGDQQRGFRQAPAWDCAAIISIR